MFRNAAIIVALVWYSHMCVASPIPEPEPGHHKTHIRIHVPHDVHTIHHHHVQKVPVLHEVPVIKHVPVLHEVPVVKHVPVVQTVHVPIVKTVAIENPSSCLIMSIFPCIHPGIEVEVLPILNFIQERSISVQITLSYHLHILIMQYFLREF